jgi:hypothetical protein
VIVRYPESGIELMDALLGKDGLLSSPQSQINLSGQVIEWSGPSVPADQVMLPDQFDEWLSEQTSRQTAAPNAIWPTIAALNGQTVGIDAVTDAPAGGVLAQWQGTRILLLPVREGEVTRLGGILDVSASAIAAPPATPLNDPNVPAPTPTSGIEFEALVADGQVAVVSFGGEGGSPPPIVAAFRVKFHSTPGADASQSTEETTASESVTPANQ